MMSKKEVRSLNHFYMLIILRLLDNQVVHVLTYPRPTVS